MTSRTLCTRVALVITLTAGLLVVDACAVKAPLRPSKRSYTGTVIPDTGSPARTVRLVFVGDTGKPGPVMNDVHNAITRETKDYVIALGDLAYYQPPRCRRGKIKPPAREALDEKLGAALGGLGAPTLLALGNHDTGQLAWSGPRQHCYLTYARDHADLVMPTPSYMVDVGPARLLILNTNNLTKRDGKRLGEEVAKWREGDGKDKILIVAGHHTLKTYHDKEKEDFVRPWLYRYGIWPDLYVNGHAHLQQFGVYDLVPALTTGASSKLRKRPSCNRAAGDVEGCGGGELWGVSTPGYALVKVTGTRLRVTYKDQHGKTLWEWER